MVLNVHRNRNTFRDRRSSGAGFGMFMAFADVGPTRQIESMDVVLGRSLRSKQSLDSSGRVGRSVILMEVPVSVLSVNGTSIYRLASVLSVNGTSIYRSAEAKLKEVALHACALHDHPFTQAPHQTNHVLQYTPSTSSSSSNGVSVYVYSPH